MEVGENLARPPEGAVGELQAVDRVVSTDEVPAHRQGGAAGQYCQHQIVAAAGQPDVRGD
ncbi:hypothetical protein D3C75_1352670 [compost metagenome]